MLTRADLNRELGNYDDSIADLQVVLKNNPNNVEAFDLLGQVYLHKQDVRNAKHYFQKIFNLQGPDYATVKSIGMCEFFEVSN